MIKIYKVKWFSWIPTNSGKIYFDYIKIPEIFYPTKSFTKDFIKIKKHKKFFKNLSTTFLSDSYDFKKVLKLDRKERASFATIYFLERSNNTITGLIKFLFYNSCSFISSFKIEKNGFISFEYIKVKLLSKDINFNDINKIIDNIKNILYIIIKNIVHGNTHHNQKIDIAIPVLDTIDYNKIADSLLDYIKLTEVNVKIADECPVLLRNENFVYEMKGFLTYFKSFVLITNSKEVHKKYIFAKQVVKSLENIVERRKNIRNHKKYFITGAFTFLGLFISINILLNGFWLKYNNDMLIFLSDFSRFIFFISSFVFILFIYYNYIKCRLISYIFYQHYKIFELLTLVKYTKFSKLNLRGKLLKLSFLIPILIFFIIYKLL